MDRKKMAAVAVIGLAAVAAVVLVGRCRGGDEAERTGGGAGSTGGAEAATGPDGVTRPLRLGETAARGPGTVEGYVIDAATGDPVPYVDVIFRQGGAETTTTSDDAGSYGIELAAGDYQVRAIGDRVVGLPQPGLRVDGGPTPVRFDVRVQQLAAVRGQVVDHRGKPVGGATVTLVVGDAGARQLVKMGDVIDSVLAGDDGRFELDVLAGGDVALEAESGGLRGRATLGAVQPGSEREVVIRLEQGAALTGIVRAPSGAAVAGALVHVSIRVDGMDQRHQLDSGEDGRFALDPVLAGQAVIEARADGYAQSVPQQVDLPPGKETRVELRLQKAEILAGRVIDVEGEPVSDVRIRAGRAGTRMKALETYSGDDGTFRLEAVDNGPYWVSAVKQGYAVTTREGVKTPVDDLTMRMTGFGGVRGTVSDADGKPLAGFTVRVERFFPAGASIPKAGGSGTKMSSTDGRFELTPLEPGTYDLAVVAPGLAPERIFDVNVPGDGWTEVAVRMKRGGRIEGRVTSAETGQPLKMARVAVAAADDYTLAFTDRDGRFTIDDVPPGRHSLLVAHAGYRPLTLGGIEVTAGATRKTKVGLTPDGGGRVIGETSGVGLVIDRRGSGEIYVREVIEGGPAARAGVKAKDTLVTIDGAGVAGLRPEQAADRLRGETGTRVVIEIARGKNTQRFELERTRFRAPDPAKGELAMR